MPGDQQRPRRRELTQVQSFAGMPADTAETGVGALTGNFYLPERTVGHEHYTEFGGDTD
jgi:hypothetical protein